ncbi:hypothetical protein E9531_03305 [Lampropedia puyangensis]|uniref:SPOR domain-containing protein n=1 Tax=Lampropedia puyangensis TaxID=1330072 RepID=A0A4S8FC49_9BURK|nr:hypothetical protein [Lampropedia puyangensis]THU04435.1 hypothetical protein E9531_03305 [Lampropedia puyangensis]
MLRMVVVVLLLANGLYFAWAQGHLASLGQMVGWGASPTLEGASAPISDSSAETHTPLNPDAIEWQLPTQAVNQPTVQSAAQSTAPAIAEPAPPNVAVSLTAAPQADAGSVTAEAAAPEQSADVVVRPEEQVSVAQEQKPQESPQPQPEPERSSPVAVAEAPKQCMAIGPFSPEQMEPIRASLQGIARNQWRIEDSPVSGRWMVFWGGASDELVLSARKGELQSKGVSHERLRSSPVGIGFSLGRFSSEAAAQQHKRDIERKGIRGTSVEVERAPSTVYTIEFPDYATIKEVVRRDLSRYFGARNLQAC